MYCEIAVKHKKAITAPGLEHAIRGPFGNDIPVPVAYGRSAIYRLLAPPPPSLFAFDTVHNCFVIVRKVNVLFSTYHLEGNTTAVSVETLLQAAQEFSNQLTGVLRNAAATPQYKAGTLTVQLFEDNGRETGMEGKLVTLSSVLGEKFGWKELKSSVIPFITAILLIWLGLKQEPVKASVYSFLIVVAFTLADAGLEYSQEDGKIKWKLRPT